MKIRADEISEILKDQIKNYKERVSVSDTGTILSVGDGIARIYGLRNAKAGEMLDFPGGLKGMVLNLKKTTSVPRFSVLTMTLKKVTKFALLVKSYLFQ